ncbi:long-chain-fatty-acid--CoA ligase [Microbulbifer pacificus]|uniref:Long-chain-fatty-acid--CoA ligase n=1 Tax=Microbulbifer pacificus TaxID=407164 RepID=A0AAU0N423_9GAMM|nr:long-chain-fatty-acid--CoA ligase [Microbulbifer pacificus]WOX07018.1 long-chain-fatty-acid--CoA ligase [Microbulbifer pacificus]
MKGLMMDSQLTVTSIMEFAERQFPDSEIVSVTKDNSLHRFTYKDAFLRVRKLANALIDYGIKRSDRIATLAWNDYRHLEIYYAVGCSGFICHTINPRLFEEQIEYIVNHAEDRILFLDPDFISLAESIQNRVACIEKFVVLTDDEHMPTTTLRGAESYESFIANTRSTISWPELNETDACSLCYTSGTTGNPKGVLYSHRSIVLHSYGAALPDGMNISIRDVVMPIVPMFHVNAWNLPYTAAMVGAKMVFPGAKMGDGATLHSLIEKEEVTFSAGVPTVWLGLLKFLSESGSNVPSLQRVVVGGSACPLSIMDEFRDKYAVEVHHAWGMTETGPLGALNSLKPGMEQLEKAELDSIRQLQGRPIYGVSIKIVNDNGEELPWDGKSVGEFRVRGPWISSGYFKDSGGVYGSHDEDGWFATGDVGTMDANGYMRITDRTKDVIKSGGEWISSIDIENVAVGHPGVAEAAVIGVRHAKWGERPLLLIVRSGKTAIEKLDMLGWLEGKIAKWWMPDGVEFVDEISHTATGKISKKDLRVQFAEYQFSDCE